MLTLMALLMRILTVTPTARLLQPRPHACNYRNQKSSQTPIIIDTFPYCKLGLKASVPNPNLMLALTSI